mgnify:CR=1 FL=1
MMVRSMINSFGFVFVLDEQGTVWSFGEMDEILRWEETTGGAEAHGEGTSALFCECSGSPLYTMNLDIVVRSLAFGDSSFYFLDEMELLWSMGSNKFGQLGLGHYNDVVRPRLVPDMKQIASITARGYAAVVTDSTGSLYSCGFCYYDSLGIRPKTKGYHTFTKVEGIPSVRQSSLGDSFQLVLDTNNNLWFFGVQLQGALSFITEQKKKLEYTGGLVTDISCGEHLLIRDEFGEVWAMGFGKGIPEHDNSYEILSLTQMLDLPKIEHIQAGDGASLLIDEIGQVWAYTDDCCALGLDVSFNKKIYNIVPDIPPMIATANSFDGTVFLSAERTIWVCGRSFAINLDLPPTGIESRPCIPTEIPGLPPIQPPFFDPGTLRKSANK